jgi:uncharacterized protein YdaU (DUF1376 family)
VCSSDLHIYRMLCLEAPFCETRPYLPDDDAQIAFIADVPDEVWAENKDAVLKMFEKTDSGYTHHRIIEEYEKACDKYVRMQKLSQAGNAAQSHTSPARAPDVDVDVDEMKNENEKRNSTSTIAIAGGGSSSSPIENPNPTPVEVRGADVDVLVSTLYTILSQRTDDVSIPANYQTYWAKDFEEALKTYAFDDIHMAIVWSQAPRCKKFYKRSKPIVENLDRLIEESKKRANANLCALLWSQAKQGTLRYTRDGIAKVVPCPDANEHEDLDDPTPTKFPPASPKTVAEFTGVPEPCWNCNNSDENKGKKCAFHKDFLPRIKTCPNCKHLPKNVIEMCQAHIFENKQYMDAKEFDL